MIVTVWVRPVGESEKEILQYAVLDDHSNVSFVSETLDNNAAAKCPC